MHRLAYAFSRSRWAVPGSLRVLASSSSTANESLSALISLGPATTSNPANVVGHRLPPRPSMAKPFAYFAFVRQCHELTMTLSKLSAQERLRYLAQLHSELSPEEKQRWNDYAKELPSGSKGKRLSGYNAFIRENLRFVRSQLKLGSRERLKSYDESWIGLSKEETEHWKTFATRTHSKNRRRDSTPVALVPLPSFPAVASDHVHQRLFPPPESPPAVSPTLESQVQQREQQP
eukprot:RCo034682